MPHRSQRHLREFWGYDSAGRPIDGGGNPIIPPPDPTLPMPRMLYDGIGHNGTSTPVVAQGNTAALIEQGKLFVAWQGGVSQLTPRVTTLDAATGEVLRAPTDINIYGLTNDDHGYPVLTVRADAGQEGRIVVYWGGHSSNPGFLRIASSAEPYDTGWSLGDWGSGGTVGSSPTYPNAITVNGRVYLFYRAEIGGVPDNPFAMSITADGSGTGSDWDGTEVVLYHANSGGQIYPSNACLNGDRIWLTCWRRTDVSGGDEVDIYCSYIDLADGDAHKAPDGTVIPPDSSISELRAFTTALVYDSTATGMRSGSGQLDFDATGKPIMTFWVEGTGVVITRWTGTAWTARKLVAADGGGAYSASPCLYVNESQVIVFTMKSPAATVKPGSAGRDLYRVVVHPATGATNMPTKVFAAAPSPLTGEVYGASDAFRIPNSSPLAGPAIVFCERDESTWTNNKLRTFAMTGAGHLWQASRAQQWLILDADDWKDGVMTGKVARDGNHDPRDAGPYTLGASNVTPIEGVLGYSALRFNGVDSYMLIPPQPQFRIFEPRDGTIHAVARNWDGAVLSWGTFVNNDRRCAAQIFSNDSFNWASKGSGSANNIGAAAGTIDRSVWGLYTWTWSREARRAYLRFNGANLQNSTLLNNNLPTCYGPFDIGRTQASGSVASTYAYGSGDLQLIAISDTFTTPEEDVAYAQALGLI